MRKKAFWIFLASMVLLVSGAVTFIQSRYFADILITVYRKYAPFDFGVEGGFHDLEIKFFPPGIVLHEPSLTLKKKNPVGFPEGTQVNAKFIDVTFQFFQALTGSVNINAVAVHGASLKLDLDERFLSEEKPVASKKKGSLSWDSLVRFHFRSMSLVDSDLELNLKGADGKVMHLKTRAKEVTVGRSTISRIATYDLAADIEKTSFEWKKIRQEVAQLQVSGEVSAEGIKIHSLGFQDGEINLHLNGTILGNVLSPKDLKTSVQYIVKGPIQDWVSARHLGGYVKLPKELAQLSGMITLEGHADGDLLNPVDTVEASAALEVENVVFREWKVESGKVKARWKRPMLQVDSVDVRMGDGRISVAEVAVDAFAQERVLKPKVTFQNADLRRMLGPAINQVYPIHLNLDGTVEAEVTLREGNEFEATGMGDLKVRNFSFDNQSPKVKKPLKVLIAVPSATVRGGFYADTAGVQFEKVRAEVADTELELNGTFSGDKGFDFDILGKVDLANLDKLAEQEIRGKGDVHWMIKGRSPAIFLIFDANLADGKYLNMNLGNVKGRVTWDDNHNRLLFDKLTATQGRSLLEANGRIDLGDVEGINLDVNIPHGTVPDMARIFSWFLRRGVPWYPSDLTGGISGPVRITGIPDIGKFSAMGNFQISNLDFKHEIVRSGSLHAGYRNGAFVAENISLLKKYGALKGNIVYGADDVLHFDVRSEGLSTLDVDQLAIWEIPYRAPLLLQAKGEGKIGRLKGSFQAALGPGSVNSLFVAPSDFEMTLDEDRLKAQGSLFSGAAKGKLSLGWAPGSASTLEVDSTHLNIQPFIVSLNPELLEEGGLSSEITGMAKLHFKTGELSRLSGVMDVRSFALNGSDYSLFLSKPFHLDLNDGDYKFDDVSVLGKNTNLTIRGESKKRTVDYRMNGAIDLSVLDYIVPEIAELKGSTRVDARLFGAAESPEFRGRFELADAYLRLRSVEQPFENLRFNAYWENSTIQFSDMASRFASGNVSGQGKAELYLTRAPDLDFQVSVENSKIKVYPVTFARTSGKMTVKGEGLPYKVKGSFRIDEALVRENFSLNEGSRILRSSKFMPQAGAGSTAEAQIFDLDLDLACERGALVQNDLFDVEMKGNLKVIHTIRSPRLLGNLTLLHGKLFFKDNFFNIQTASIVFNNPALLDPEISATAVSDVKGYKILLVASGKVSEYKLAFESQPPLSQNDIVSLLTLGMTSTGYKDITGDRRDAYSSSELYGMLFSQSGIGKGIKETLGMKKLNVRVSQSQTNAPQSAFSRRSSTDVTETASPKVEVQYEVTKSLKASAGSTVGVGTNQERAARLEASPPESFPKWTKPFSVMGVYEDQRGPQPGSQRNSVGGDLKFRKTFK